MPRFLGIKRVKKNHNIGNRTIFKSKVIMFTGGYKTFFTRAEKYQILMDSGKLKQEVSKVNFLEMQTGND